jgi:hypothetical protein
MLAAFSQLAGLVELILLDPCPAKAAQRLRAVVSIPRFVFDKRMPVAASLADLSRTEFRLTLSLEAPEPCKPPIN